MAVVLIKQQGLVLLVQSFIFLKPKPILANIMEQMTLKIFELENNPKSGSVSTC